MCIYIYSYVYIYINIYTCLYIFKYIYIIYFQIIWNYIYTSELILEPFDDPCFDWRLGLLLESSNQVPGIYTASCQGRMCTASIFPRDSKSLRNLTGSSTARQSPFDSEEVENRGNGEVKAEDHPSYHDVPGTVVTVRINGLVITWGYPHPPTVKLWRAPYKPSLSTVSGPGIPPSYNLVINGIFPGLK